MSIIKYDGRLFKVFTDKVFRDEGDQLIEEGVMASVKLLDPKVHFGAVPVVDAHGKVGIWPTVEVAVKEARRFIVMKWEREKQKPKLPVGTRVWVGPTSKVGTISEPNYDSHYFRVKFDNGEFDIHETDLTVIPSY